MAGLFQNNLVGTERKYVPGLFIYRNIAIEDVNITL